MTRRKHAKPKPRPESWIVGRDTKLNGPHTEPGTEMTIRDHTGRKIRTRFVELVHNDSIGESWVTVSQIDRKTGDFIRVRSFDIGKVLTVHVRKMQRKPKTRARK